MVTLFTQLLSAGLHLTLIYAAITAITPPQGLESGHGFAVELVDRPSRQGFSQQQLQIKNAQARATNNPTLPESPQPATAATPQETSKLLTQAEQSPISSTATPTGSDPKSEDAAKSVSEAKTKTEQNSEQLPIDAQPAPAAAAQDGDSLEQTTDIEGLSKGIREAGEIHQRPGNVPPQYPVQDRLNGREGRVIVLALINPQGGVVNMEIESSTGSYAMEQAVLKAFSRYQFMSNQPGYVRWPFAFQLVGPDQTVGSAARVKKQATLNP